MPSIENGRQKPSLDIFIQICNLLNVTPDYLLLGSMHAYNIPQDIIDKLRLCNQSDIELAGEIVIKMSFHTHFLHLEILCDKMYTYIYLESQVKKCVF